MMTDKLTAEQWRRAIGKKVTAKKSKWRNIRVTDKESGGPRPPERDPSAIIPDREYWGTDPA